VNQFTVKVTDSLFRPVLKPEKSIPERANRVGTFPNEVRKEIMRTAFAGINAVKALRIFNLDILMKSIYFQTIAQGKK